MSSSSVDDHHSDSDGGYSGYGDTSYDADDQHASSDSELVSHPSDNEDQLLLRSTSASPSPAHSTATHNNHTDNENDEEDDGETPQASFTFSRHDHHHRHHQDLAHLAVPSAVRRPQVIRRTREQDDYFMVESSDLEGNASSRPQSSMSHNSEDTNSSSHPGGPMHFIYPSMALSPSPPPHLLRDIPVKHVEDTTTTNEAVVQPATPSFETFQSQIVPDVITTMSASTPMEESQVSSVSSSSTLTSSHADVIKIRSSSSSLLSLQQQQQQGSVSQEYDSSKSISEQPHEPSSTTSTTHDIAPVETPSSNQDAAVSSSFAAPTELKIKSGAATAVPAVEHMVTATDDEKVKTVTYTTTSTSSRTVQTLRKSRSSKSEEEFSRISSGDEQDQDQDQDQVVPLTPSPPQKSTSLSSPPKEQQHQRQPQQPVKKPTAIATTATTAARPLTPAEISAQRYTVTGSFDIINTETLRTVALGLFVIISVLFAGFATHLTYQSWIEASRTAHAEIASVRYAHDHRLAVAHLQTYSANFEPRTSSSSSKSETYHVRVLTDDRPWSLQEAPEHVTIFGEPIVRDFFNGTYIYVRSLYRPKRPQRLSTTTSAKTETSSPWICSDDAFYLHVWFANGTRISDHATEIFTTKALGTVKPLSCLTTGTGTKDRKAAVDPEKEGASEDMDDEEEEADYIRYWRQRWQTTTAKVKSNLLEMSRQVNWREIQKSVSEVPYLIEQALFYTRRSLFSWTSYLVEWARTFLYQSDNVIILNNDKDDVLNRAQTIFERARLNAKKTTDTATDRLKEFADKIQSQFQGATPPQVAPHPFEQVLKEQIHQVQKVVQENAELFSTRNVLQVADDLFLEAEAGVEALWHSKAMKHVAKVAHVEDLKKQAKKVSRAAEDKIESMMQSKVVRGVNERWQQGLEDFQSTATGGAVTKKAKEIKKNVRRRWRRLQRDIILGF
ncbi:hypothetical protein BGZ83_007481 [Gryganskiella cystojenkinii]|nr:hypothetical protein BGZ83_007481 [Gryganskiella cystojenkinii]